MYSTSRVLLLAMLVGFLKLLPEMLTIPAADAVLNYMQIDCFSKQIWSGILYPRWCVDANGGMGSPGPIFYFPFAYYVTALFAPLKYLGMSLEGHYLLGMYLANITAFLTCTFWLSRLVSQRTALFCAMLFVFGFYRSEVISRGSYAEYWCLSMLPLMFMYVHLLCHSRRRIWPQLALVLTACMLTHAPMTLIGMMGAGMYLLLSNLAAFLPFTLAAGIATFVTLPHYLPMKLLAFSLNDRMGGFSHWRLSWVNSYMDDPRVYLEHGWAMLGFLIGVLTLLFVMIAFYRYCRHMSYQEQHEGACWILIAGVALTMMVSVTAPLWHLIEMISGVATPWRMQALVLLALVMCVALLADRYWFQKTRTRQGDRVVCALFFVLLSLFYIGGARKEDLNIHERLVKEQYSLIFFATQDMSSLYGDVDRFFRTFIDRPNRQKAEWVQSDAVGSAEVLQWDAHGLRLRLHADRAGTLRLDHFAYPIWQARLNDQPVTINAEPVSGRMLLEVPKGDFSLELTQDYWGMIWRLL